jgi:anti-sigma factor RsiW
MTHLGDRITALVDGELDHAARERALAHVAHCAACRDLIEAERTTKETLSASLAPLPSEHVLGALRSLAQPGGPLPPRARHMPQGPVVPLLPPPGRRRDRGRVDARGPASTHGRSLRQARRARYAAAGALSVAGLVLGTAFAAGAPRDSGSVVVPPAAELSVEHTATTTGVTFGDPGLGVAGSFGDASYPAGPAAVRR